MKKYNMLYLNCTKSFSTYPSVSQKCCSQSCSTTYRAKMGNQPKGYKWSEEAKKRKSEFMKDYIIKNDNTLITKRVILKGEDHPNWKGGVSKDNRFTGEYKKWRLRVFVRDDYTCQICNATEVYLHADHIKSYADHPALRYNIDNGRTLCVPCHYYVTFKKKMPHGISWGGRIASF